MNTVIRALGRRLRLGLVGGGPGSFIGPVHRRAARFDECFEIVAAALSSDPARSRTAAADIGIASDRAYSDWQSLIAGEIGRDDGIDALAVMTPNHLHYPVAIAALNAGLHVICDKPLTNDLKEARDLVRMVKETGFVFCVTYNYSQYPMVRQARALATDGQLGEIRQVHLTYVQGHNANLVEAEQPQRAWRFEPSMAGASLILGDIGTHAHHLGGYVSNLDLDAVMADVGTTVPGRQSDDYAALLLKWSNGARGTLMVTNAAAGAEHGLGFKVFGSKGGVEWNQESPNQLLVRRLDHFAELQTRRLHGAMQPLAEQATRLEIGHPEGYQEAFAFLYRSFAEAIVEHHTQRAREPLAFDFPTVLDGAKGIRFIESALESSQKGCWVDCRLEL